MTAWRARVANDEHRRLYLVGALVVLGFCILLFWRMIFVLILPGQAGVRYDLFFGTRLHSIAREGLNVKLPWNSIVVYDLRLQTLRHKVFALSREGMGIEIDFAVIFRPDAAGLPRLHQHVGSAYVERTITPLSMGAVRQYVAQHDSHELYTVEAEAFQRNVLDGIRADLAHYQIVVTDVILEKLTLPKAILAAIEQKLTHEQLAAAYDFRLESERAEAQRLDIKGAGLSRYFGLVGAAGSPSLLTWRGIEATVELSQSPNTRIIIVGGGKDQPPVILGSDVTRPADTPAARPGGRPPAAGDGTTPRVFSPGDGPPAVGTPGPSTPSTATPPQR
jgi:regulator of protease activity HflC (stomatin/prohibitin superfamily)